MLYLKDLHIGDRFISREYEMTAEEIKNLPLNMIHRFFIWMKSKQAGILFFKVWPQVAGTPLQLPCVYGQSAFR